MRVFEKRLYDFGFPAERLDGGKLMLAIRNAIPKGVITYIEQADDVNNPLDRQLEVYTYVDLKNINMDGIAKIKVLCRLSVFNGTLSVRTVQKYFKVDMPQGEAEEQDYEGEPIERDYSDYPDRD
jgi:hypothetical protein